MFIPHFVQNELDAGDIDLANKLSAFNWCNPFDHILPFADGSVNARDRAHLWGLYAAISVNIQTVVVRAHKLLAQRVVRSRPGSLQRRR